MPKTTQAKKTSEERCHEAFEAWWPHSFIAILGSAEKREPEIAWTACWRYLEKQVREEFIER